MTYSAKAISNSFLTLANRDDLEIDPMQMQKLLYLANGYYMAENDQAPLVNEYFEAWDYGPVVPTVYYEFREFGRDRISRYAREWSPRRGKRVIVPQPVGDAKAEDIIEWVWDAYGDWSGPRLSRLTHKKGGPWDLARKRANNRGFRNEAIDPEEIYKYFRPLVD